MPIGVRIILFAYILTIFWWIINVLCMVVTNEHFTRGKTDWDTLRKGTEMTSKILGWFILFDIATFVPMAFWFMFLR